MVSWKRMLALAVASGAVGLVLTGAPAAAQQRPCQDDLKKLCPDAKPGTPEALKCLQSHEAQLSDACKARIAKAHERMQKANKTHEVCKADIEKFCKDAPRGGGKVRECLQQHQADVSADCKAVLTAHANKPKTPGAAKPKPN